MLIQWMVPILLVMGIYLAIWTVAEPPTAEDVSTHVNNIDWYWEGAERKWCHTFINFKKYLTDLKVWINFLKNHLSTEILGNFQKFVTNSRTAPKPTHSLNLTWQISHTCLAFRSRISRDWNLSNALTTGTTMHWPSAKCSFCCGAFVYATMYGTLNRYTMRQNWSHMLSTILLSSISLWPPYSEYIFTHMQLSERSSWKGV